MLMKFFLPALGSHCAFSQILSSHNFTKLMNNLRITCEWRTENPKETEKMNKEVRRKE